MTLEERLNADLKEAMRSGDTARKMAIRSVKAALTEAKVAGEQARELTDEDVLAIIIKLARQRRDSITEFARGGRADLVAKEQADLAVLETYLPKQLDDAAIRERAGGDCRSRRGRSQGDRAGDAAADGRLARAGRWPGYQPHRARAPVVGNRRLILAGAIGHLLRATDCRHLRPRRTREGRWMMQDE